jgi:hypothetical protein
VFWIERYRHRWIISMGTALPPSTTIGIPAKKIRSELNITSPPAQAMLTRTLVTGPIPPTIRLAAIWPSAYRWRDVLIARAHGQLLAGFVLVVAICATATALAAWLVRRFSPHASGSGKAAAHRTDALSRSIGHSRSIPRRRSARISSGRGVKPRSVSAALSAAWTRSLASLCS